MKVYYSILLKQKPFKEEPEVKYKNCDTNHFDMMGVFITLNKILLPLA